MQVLPDVEHGLALGLVEQPCREGIERMLTLSLGVKLQRRITSFRER